METINILWTGGWDSTFRVVELSQKEVCIQPYYVVEKNRISQKYELQTMEKITKKLQEHPNTKATFLPIQLVHKSEIQKNEQISKTYKEIFEIYHIGSQYDYLARLALTVERLELSVEKAPTSKVLDFIQACGRLEKVNIKGGDTYIIDVAQSSEELKLLFQNFSFPVIDKSKVDMRDIAKQQGYEDIMNMTWFCHSPIHDEPCGLCNPCLTTMAGGMEHRFPENSIKRYKKRKILRPIRRITNKVKKICGKERKYT